jgi:hypothetical protein
LLNAARGQTATADDYVGSISGQDSKACKGTFGSIVKRLPSTEGSLIRQLIAKCAEKGLTTNTVATVVRKPDGLLVKATVIAPLASSAGGFVSGLKPTPQHDGVGSGFVDAALEISR